MKDFGGFDHNKQSLRIVTELEQRYPDFPGLNLTWEVREGMVKHESEYDVTDARDLIPNCAATWKHKSVTWPTNWPTPPTIWMMAYVPA